MIFKLKEYCFRWLLIGWRRMLLNVLWHFERMWPINFKLRVTIIILLSGACFWSQKMRTFLLIILFLNRCFSEQMFCSCEIPVYSPSEMSSYVCWLNLVERIVIWQVSSHESSREVNFNRGSIRVIKNIRLIYSLLRIFWKLCQSLSPITQYFLYGTEMSAWCLSRESWLWRRVQVCLTFWQHYCCNLWSSQSSPSK